MAVYKCVFVFFIMVVMVYCRPQELDSENMFKEHQIRVKNFPCSVPQPRAMSLEKLWKDPLLTDEMRRPEMTVLHQCDQYTGCCRANEICSPDSAELVEIVFSTFRDNQRAFKTIQVLNHTSCACRRNDKPK